MLYQLQSGLTRFELKKKSGISTFENVLKKLYSTTWFHSAANQLHVIYLEITCTFNQNNGSNLGCKTPVSLVGTNKPPELLSRPFHSSEVSRVVSSLQR